MKFVSSVGPVGPEEIQNLGGAKLVTVFNELRSANGEPTTKRFSDNVTGRRRTLSAYETWAARQSKKATPIPYSNWSRPNDSPKADSGSRSSLAAVVRKPSVARVVSTPSENGLIMLPAADKIRPHKPSTNRGKIIALGCREQGVTMKEMQELTGWVPQQIRSCLRQINAYCGHGIEERAPDHFFISGTPRSRKEMYWPARDEVREYRKGTKRAKVIEMLRRPEGATFSAIKEACGWNDTQAYEGIKLVHGYVGYGIREKDGVIRAFTKAEEQNGDS